MDLWRSAVDKECPALPSNRSAAWGNQSLFHDKIGFFLALRLVPYLLYQAWYPPLTLLVDHQMQQISLDSLVFEGGCPSHLLKYFLK
jgi:hypothetical protein